MSFTSTQAKSVNLVAGALAGAIVGFYLFKKKFSLQKIAIIAVVCAVLTWFIVKQLTDTIVDSINKPGAAPLPDAVDPDFSPTSYTNGIHEAINKNWWDQVDGVDDQAYQDLINITSGELTLVYNDWLDRFYDEDDETLTQALINHNIYILAWNWEYVDQIRDILVERLQSNNLM